MAITRLGLTGSMTAYGTFTAKAAEAAAAGVMFTVGTMYRTFTVGAKSRSFTVGTKPRTFTVPEHGE